VLPSPWSILDLTSNRANLVGAGADTKLGINTPPGSPAGPSGGSFTIDDLTELELFGASTATVSFGTAGVLKLDASSQFSGQVVGFGTGGTGQEPTFTVNGSAVNTATHVYTVTPNAQLQHGSVMSDVRVDLTKTFDFTFDINVGNSDNGADGMGFVLHNDPLGRQALGDNGGSLGMLGINNG